MNDWLWQALFGSYCVLCRERVKGAAGPRQLCDWCLASLPWRPVPEEAPALSDITSTFAPLAYEGAARQWVLDAKRESGLIQARMLGVLLGPGLAGALMLDRDGRDAVAARRALIEPRLRNFLERHVACHAVLPRARALRPVAAAVAVSRAIETIRRDVHRGAGAEGETEHEGEQSVDQETRSVLDA